MHNNLYLLLSTVDHVVIRTAGCRFFIWALFACLFTPVTSSAHLLNMTELHLDSTHPTSTKLKIKIDLGQSLMTAEEYWNASTSDIQEQSITIEEIADEIKSGVRLTVDDRSVDFELHSWNLEASSLEAIKNPFSPQMAQLVFDLNSTMPSEGSVEIQIDEQLEVPWPALLRMDHASSPLPISRLLTERERSSRPIRFGNYLETPEEELSAKAVLAIQTLVPGLKWIALGFQHIIPKGLDHIVFVLGLFFLSTGVKTLILQVSCFTLAHSLTLGMATFGLVSAPGAIVEPLIAASIICIAVGQFIQRKSGSMEIDDGDIIWVTSWSRLCLSFERTRSTKREFPVVASFIQYWRRDRPTDRFDDGIRCRGVDAELVSIH